jgi:hypothetical protein
MMVAPVNGQSRENRDRAGTVARHAPPGLLVRFPVLKLAREQRVVADRRAGICHDEGARRVTPLGLPGVADNPTV